MSSAFIPQKPVLPSSKEGIFSSLLQAGLPKKQATLHREVYESMGSLFNPPKPKPPPAPVDTTSADLKAELDREAEKLRKRRGRAATIATSPTGVSEDTPLARPTLLGQ